MVLFWKLAVATLSWRALRWRRLESGVGGTVGVAGLGCAVGVIQTLRALAPRVCGKKRTRNEKESVENLLAVSFSKSKVKPNQPVSSRVTSRYTAEPDQTLDLTNSNLQSPSFIQLIRERYRQACRSVVVRTQSPESTVQALSSFGTLKFAHCVSNDQQYLLAEFVSEGCLRKLQESSQFFFESKKFPLISRSLFDETNGTVHKNKKRKGNIPLLLEDLWHHPSPSPSPRMANLDEELLVLSESKALNDLDLRLRFLACVMVEDLVRPLLPEARVIPYGSCLNGFGWWDSDLDMMLCMQGDLYVPGGIKRPRRPGLPTSFKFLTEVFPTERLLAQKSLSLVASLLELGSRFNNVHKILNAHVPIVRFHAATLNLQCDVSLEALDSIKMTELLYTYSSLDDRVRPLMTGIKQWALSHGLTSSGEQQKPTTIGLLCLLVFYLQSCSPQVLPTLRTLQKSSAPSDLFFIDDVVYGIPSNPSILPKSKNTESLESLLHGFFVFYSGFDFESKAISIIEGESFPKPAESSPVYVENPLCIGLNICKNISHKNLESFIDAMKMAAQKIDSQKGTSPPPPSSSSSAAAVAATASGEQDLKVPSLCDSKAAHSRLFYLFNSDVVDGEQEVMVEVADLFTDDMGASQAKNIAAEDLKERERKLEDDNFSDAAYSTGNSESAISGLHADSSSVQANHDNSSLPDDKEHSVIEHGVVEKVIHKKS
ncbi:poly(a) RNA polymerase [Plakobranchus ocellatus]|uniref:Poly(A) RNA polymerase n=1 Tax=Plakobranchus ocellatus TaxID=259542 RepID=A0AAV4A0D2_9GAST|nr:poly(a) RNA polymerase [Plakobranchus ocellatus]